MEDKYPLLKTYNLICEFCEKLDNREMQIETKLERQRDDVALLDFL